MDEKRCNSCGEVKPFSEFHAAKGCVGGVAGTCKNCRNTKNEAWTSANRGRVNAAAKVRRIAALQAYSAGPVPICACCDEKEIMFLTFEHIGGGGGAHRRETGGGGFISWLRKNNYPAGLEVLCMNCNHGRRVNAGVCPHVTGDTSDGL